jgi:hypothetical protein
MFSMSVDVIIPLGPKDEDIVGRCIASVRQWVNGVRHIFVIAHRPMEIPGTFVVNESQLPFSREEVVKRTSEVRAGWYTQQLAKFYAPLLISNILENCVVIDADVVFYRRVKFLEGDKFLFDKNHEIHQPYFDHMKRLHPSFEPWKQNFSGIVNCMIFNKKILTELIEKVEIYQKKPFWEAYLDCIDRNYVSASGAAEYELYFHYVMKNYEKRTTLRPLQYSNGGQRWESPRGDWHYITYHHYVQKPSRLLSTTNR